MFIYFLEKSKKKVYPKPLEKIIYFFGR